MALKCAGYGVQPFLMSHSRCSPRPCLVSMAYLGASSKITHPGVTFFWGFGVKPPCGWQKTTTILADFPTKHPGCGVYFCQRCFLCRKPFVVPRWHVTCCFKVRGPAHRSACGGHTAWEYYWWVRGLGTTRAAGAKDWEVGLSMAEPSSTRMDEWVVESC